jgi:hypothetical protein
MRRRRMDDASPASRTKYEQSYGDAEPGGWAPRGRYEDLAERSHYSSQRDRQEDRSGFRRGYQGQQENNEADRWAPLRSRSDELAPGESEAAVAADVQAVEAFEHARPKPPGIRPKPKVARRRKGARAGRKKK